MTWPALGLGAGWRPELAWDIERCDRLGFVEVMAESIERRLPTALEVLRERGVVVIPHGIRLGLGGSGPGAGLRSLVRSAKRLRAPFVSEHVAFVRTKGLEAGHLLPVPRTREALDILCANVRAAEARLPVPLVLENIAATFAWPENELTEGEFLAELLDRTSVGLLLDLANLHANELNFGEDARAVLDALPLERVAYTHVAGGVLRGRFFSDSHAHAVPDAVFQLVEELSARTEPRGILLERDDHWPSREAWTRELEQLAEARDRGSARRVRIDAHVKRPAAPPKSPEPRRAFERSRHEARLAGVLECALLAAPPPAGLDPDHLARTARILLEKRAKPLRKRFSNLPPESFWDAFVSFARRHPLRRSRDIDSDETRFARWLARHPVPFPASVTIAADA